LAFASDADGDFEIYVYEISSANISKMTNNEVDDIDPDWSSAGSNLVYSSDRISPTRFQLYNMASSGSDAEANAYAITDLDGSNTDAAWSPTSGLIVFRNQDGTSSKLMIRTALSIVN
jgi:Tol biopolymer transport system component